MTIEVSTANTLLVLGIGLQAWIVREIFKVKAKVSILVAHCDHCKHNNELDTEHISKPV